jgi:hypothetical protein
MKKINPLVIAFVVALLSSSLMLQAAFQENATPEEITNITSSYACLKNSLSGPTNQTSPLFLKISLALPLLATQVNFPALDPARPDPEFAEIGRQFLYASNNDADLVTNLARLLPILLAALLVLFVYFWSKKLMGKWWALLPAVLIAFSPLFLSHGHLATPYILKTFLIFALLYFFVRFLENHSPKNLALSILVFGLCQLVGFSLVFLLPYFLFLAIVFSLAKTERQAKSKKLRPKFKLQNANLLILVAAFFIASSGLAFSAYFFLDNSTGSTLPIAEKLSLAGKTYISSFALRNYSQSPEIPYFLGAIFKTLPWYYSPAVFLLKTPLPILLAFAIAFILSLTSLTKTFLRKKLLLREYLQVNFAEFSMIIFVVAYSALILASPRAVGSRELLPILPFLVILSAEALKNWKFRARPLVFFVLIVWLGTETISASPNYLSYFNELGMTGSLGYKTAVGAEYDLGQDLKKLRAFVEKNNIQKIAVDYYGEANLEYYLSDKARVWTSADFSPKEAGIDWLAISATKLELAKGKPVSGISRNPEDEYQWLKNPYEPFGRAGRSIFIYKLD